MRQLKAVAHFQATPFLGNVPQLLRVDPAFTGIESFTSDCSPDQP
jgi:hypothetical protein